MKTTKNNMTLVIEFSAYCDGDWGIDDNLIKNHTSRYFDQRYYEYSKPFNDDATVKFRRVYLADELKDAASFLAAVRDSLHGDEDDTATIRKYFDAVINDLHNVISQKVSCDKAFHTCHGYIGDKPIYRATNEFSYYIDSNTELDFTGYFTDECPQKIKKIIYEK